MALSEDESATVARLSASLLPGSVQQRDLTRLEAYYEGIQRLEQLGLAVPPELEKFVTIVNWPRIAVDSLEERIDLEGFRLAGEDEADDELWRIWQANDLDEESQLAHLDSLIFRRSYACAGANENDADTPLVTIESPQEMTHESSPRTRATTAALRLYDATMPALGVAPERRATLYLPDATIWLRRARNNRWAEEDRDQHNIGRCLVEPLVNRPRTKKRGGASEMADVIPLTDAAARALTNAQVATEVLAIPQRWAAAVAAKDFESADGKPLTTWETYFGAVWATENPDAKFGQFAAADLNNFTAIVEHYQALVSGMTGLPMRYFGSNTANPPSAEGIRADEARLIKRAERRQRTWGGSWERVMRNVVRIQTGEDDPSLANMETLWRDPATPTRAQAADAVVKLTQGDRPILPREAAWEELGYSFTRRQKLRRMFAEQSRSDLLGEDPETVEDDDEGTDEVA